VFLNSTMNAHLLPLANFIQLTTLWKERSYNSGGTQLGKERVCGEKYKNA